MREVESKRVWTRAKEQRSEGEKGKKEMGRRERERQRGRREGEIVTGVIWLTNV